MCNAWFTEVIEGEERLVAEGSFEQIFGKQQSLVTWTGFASHK
jgi:hypothetical protein